METLPSIPRQHVTLVLDSKFSLYLKNLGPSFIFSLFGAKALSLETISFSETGIIPSNGMLTLVSTCNIYFSESEEISLGNQRICDKHKKLRSALVFA